MKLIFLTLFGLIPAAQASDTPTQEEDFSPALVIGGLKPDAVDPEEIDIDAFIADIMRGSELHAQWFRDLEKVKTKRKERQWLDWHHDGATTYGRRAYDMMLARLLNFPSNAYEWHDRNLKVDAITFCHVAHVPVEDWDREARKWMDHDDEVWIDEWQATLHFIKFTHPELEPHECSCPPIP